MGHWSQRGPLGVHNRAPNSIMDWLKSPGLSGSTSVLAIVLEMAQCHGYLLETTIYRQCCIKDLC